MMLPEKPTQDQLVAAYEELRRCYALRGSMPYMGGTPVMEWPLDRSLAELFDRANDASDRAEEELQRLRALESDVRALRRVLGLPE